VNTYEIDAFALPFSSYRLGNVRFMEYQKEVLEREEKILAIKAPTGAGKTLAMLKKALDSTEKGCTALFLYPTNELLFDQYRAFSHLLEVMGYDAGFVSLNEVSGDLKIDRAEVLVFPVNGQHLEYLSKGRTKGSVLREVLNSPEVVDSKLLILSNVDFLYNLVRGCYSRAELTFPDLVKTLSFIAVDELHMYWGTTFLSLLFMLKNLERVSNLLISSATHTSTLKTLLDSLESDWEIVNAVLDENENNWRENDWSENRVVRHRTWLEIDTFGDYPYMSSDKHLELAVKKARELMEECDDLLCIFNSVIFAEKVARELEKFEEVGRIHGFVPKDVREEMRNKRVVVGTSSIEVGVDFDREGLLFEANNAPSFLQRFGRVGRHRDGKAVALLPFQDWKMLSNRLNGLKGQTKIPFTTFEKTVWDTLENPRDYSELKNSYSGAKLYLSYVASLLSLSKRTYGRDERVAKFEKARVVLERIEDLAKSKVHNPKIDDFILDGVLQEVRIRTIPGAFEIIKLSRVFPRGGMPSVPVFFEEFGVFELMSIDNLEKAELHVVNAGEIGVEKPRWLKAMGNVPVFVIEDLNLNNYFKVIVMTSTDEVFTLWRDEGIGERNFKVLSAWGEEVNSVIEGLLDGLPAYFTFKVPDWRFSYLRAKKGRNYGYIVLGGDAYICRERGFT